MTLQEVLELVADNTMKDLNVDIEQLITNIINEYNSIDLRAIDAIEKLTKEYYDDGYNDGKDSSNE